MKMAIAQNTSFNEIKKIADEVYSGRRAKWGQAAREILFKNGFKMRQRDGQLVETNFSIPKSKQNSFVLGLRYIKRDKTFTEDHFLFEKDKSIIYFRGKRLEYLLKEYTGTHKKQIAI